MACTDLPTISQVVDCLQNEGLISADTENGTIELSTDIREAITEIEEPTWGYTVNLDCMQNWNPGMPIEDCLEDIIDEGSLTSLGTIFDGDANLIAMLPDYAKKAVLELWENEGEDLEPGSCKMRIRDWGVIQNNWCISCVNSSGETVYSETNCEERINMLTIGVVSLGIAALLLIRKRK